MECSTKGPSGGCGSLFGVPLPPGLLVVRGAAVGPRAIDQPARGVGHGLPADSDRRNCYGLDGLHGSFTSIIEEWPKEVVYLILFEPISAGS